VTILMNIQSLLLALKPMSVEPALGWILGLELTIELESKKNELNKYLEEKQSLQDIPFDILQYWKMSYATYPIFARMARDISLVIPASTVASSESAFSSGENYQ